MPFVTFSRVTHHDTLFSDASAKQFFIEALALAIAEELTCLDYGGEPCELRAREVIVVLDGKRPEDYQAHVAFFVELFALDMPDRMNDIDQRLAAIETKMGPVAFSCLTGEHSYDQQISILFTPVAKEWWR